MPPFSMVSRASLSAPITADVFRSEERWLALALYTLLFARSHLGDAVRWRRELLRRRPTMIDNELAHVAPHAVVCLVGRVPALDAFAPELIFCLRRAEEVGGKLRAAHMV